MEGAQLVWKGEISAWKEHLQERQCLSSLSLFSDVFLSIRVGEVVPLGNLLLT